MTKEDSILRNHDSLLNRRNVLKTIGIAGLTSASASSITAAKEKSNCDEFDVIEATVADILSAIITENTTAHAVTEQYLERIKAYDDELDSIITVNEGALDRADVLDDTFAKSGPVGPLHGVPVILKDNFDTDDLPTTAGSVSLEGSVPPDDAFLVKQLREAGAIILAKANMSEFAYTIQTVSSLGGQTSNAYALDRLPSGSSGGSATAIAANLGAIGTGTDTCSSIRSPPAFNNSVGVRPSMGLLSRDGIIPLSETQDTGGPITRTVADAAIMLDVMAGYDPSDQITAKSVGNIPEEGYTSHLDEDGLDGAQIGVARQLFGIQGDNEDLPIDDEDAAEVTEVINAAIEDMNAAGATIVDPVTFDGTLNYTSQIGAQKFEFKRDFNNYLDSLGDNAPIDSLKEIIETGQYFPKTFRSDEYEASELAGGLTDTLKSLQEINVDTLDENTDYL
jgi:amidase